MQAIITVGTSASGKSTYAREMVKQGYTEINRDWIRFNVVQPGANWSNYKWKHEKEVNDVHGKMIVEAWMNDQNIIVSDTNLNAVRREALIKRLEDIGYEVTIAPFDVSREECQKRDNLRENGVGESVIYRQSLDMLDFQGRKTYTPDPSLPKAIIVDVDGTVADMTGVRGPFEWKKVGEDKPRQFVIDMVTAMYQTDPDLYVIIVSGRSDECEDLTYNWLEQHNVPFTELHMRKEGDYRKDAEIKEEIFWTSLANRYNIVACIDDRPMMIRRWHELKIPNVIAVANPYLEF